MRVSCESFGRNAGLGGFEGTERSFEAPASLAETLEAELSVEPGTRMQFGHEGLLFR